MRWRQETIGIAVDVVAAGVVVDGVDAVDNLLELSQCQALWSSVSNGQEGKLRKKKNFKLACLSNKIYKCYIKFKFSKHNS